MPLNLSFQRHCKWRGVDVPCQEIFDLIPTDRGFCCSFNHDTLEKTLRKSSYVSSLDELDKRWVLSQAKQLPTVKPSPVVK